MKKVYPIILAVIAYTFLAFTANAQNIKLNFIQKLPDKLEESSALIHTSKGIFTLSDNNDSEIYKIDPESGLILQIIKISGISFSDKEALAANGDFLFIGDFGNNDGDRKDLKIVRINLGEITDSEKLTLSGDIISFHYPEQKSFDVKKSQNAFDAEALVAFGEKLFLFTKQRNDHQTTMYELPSKPGNYAAKKLDTFDVNGRITDAAVSPDGNTLLLLGYQDDHLYSFLWKFSGFSELQFFSGNADYQLLTVEPIDWQTEGLTFISETDFIISCETTKDVRASIYHGDLLKLFN